MLKRSDMHDRQENDVEILKENSAYGLWRQMGLGKTITTATALRDMMDDFTIGRALIVAPKRVALTTWPLEFRKWEHLQGIRTEVITGNKKERIQGLLKRSDIHIISRDNLGWLWETCGKKWPWDTVVIDESSSFKSQSSNRWKAMRQARRRIKRIFELTATPSPNGLQDLWAQIYLMDFGQRLGATEKDFHQRWFNYDKSGYGLIPKDHAEAEIHEILSDIVSSMKAEDYLDMPDLIMNSVECDLEPAVMKQYKKFERDMIIQLRLSGDGRVQLQVGFAAHQKSLPTRCGNGRSDRNAGKVERWQDQTVTYAPCFIRTWT
jgi:SNF2 family DNA or RNA helicase